MFKLFNFGKKEPPKQNKPSFSVKSRKAFLAGEVNRHTYNWKSYKHTIDEIIDKYYPILVARSCQQCMNDPYAKKFLNLLKNNVIGPLGVQLIAKAKDPNGTLDPVANRAIEDSWDTWGEDYCDVVGKLNLIEMQNLTLTTLAREGEVIVRIIKGKYAGPWGFALQLIDPRRLDFYKREISLSNGNFIKFGIEFNPYGKPVNYYILEDDQYDYYQTLGKYQIVPADEIMHIFLTEYIDQKRGLPWMSPVLMRMNMLAGFEEAAVENARAGACQMGFIKSSDPEAQNDDEDQEIEIEATPASFTQLPAGWEVDKYDPTYPSNEFDAFSKAILRGISSGLDVSYNNLANDLTAVNFSSLRQGALDERNVWMCLQQWFISKFHKRIFIEWLKYSLLAGKIRTPNGKALPAEKFDKFKNADWQPKRWPWIDPVKDTNAAIASNAAGLTSKSNIIREQGRDPDTVWDEIQRENIILKDKDILTNDELIKGGNNAKSEE